MASGLDELVGFDGITIVPDRHDDGTNVMCIPADVVFRFSYGQGSYSLHLCEALQTGRQVRTLRIPSLGWDVDVPADLDSLPLIPAGRIAAPSQVASRLRVR
jgi:2-phospho-L-lactate guanylyltransferase (CobY/MobA/RfbA family)